MILVGMMSSVLHGIIKGNMAYVFNQFTHPSNRQCSASKYLSGIYRILNEYYGAVLKSRDGGHLLPFHALILICIWVKLMMRLTKEPRGRDPLFE